jgi:hypothetical protein
VTVTIGYTGLLATLFLQFLQAGGGGQTQFFRLSKAKFFPYSPNEMNQMGEVNLGRNVSKYWKILQKATRCSDGKKDNYV